ncbi:hypothetical protein DUNSADRAFT_354 [Dunaliella salina]|nr:hypothetical protein DUNSADRAFT_354 [Dunaliella salina]|eukprot:KAF5827603.1 hypothetical protein DUNSADRAFT_354 [Dunaliella salina]
MRTFWRAFFDKQPKVDWGIWWLNFPEHLKKIMFEEGTVKVIESRFSDESAKSKFQKFISKGNPSKKISVEDVHHAFPFCKGLLDVIDEALGFAVANQGPSPSLPPRTDGQAQPDRPNSPSRLPISSMPCAASLKRTASRSPRPGEEQTLLSHIRCGLPYLDRLYRGRDQEAAMLEHKLRAQLDRKDGNCKAAICLKASAGMGKSTLGLDVGWRMAMSGKCPAGVQMADMREAWSYEEVLGRFCSTLGMTMDENTTDEIPARLRSLCQEYGGPIMLLVDNAEDPLAGKKDLAGKPETSKDPAKFMSLIAKIAREAVLLITSRVPLESPCVTMNLHHHELGGMDDKSCQALLREALMQEMAPKLSDTQIEEVVHICRGVPLLVRLAGDALRTGQLSVEEVREATEKDANATTAITKLMIRTLPSKHQQYLAQLATFPSGFDEEGAAAVLDWDMPRASSLLVVLWNHGLVAWDASYNTYSLHAMVRTCAVELLRKAMPAVVRQARINFVVFTFHQMDRQASIYNTKAWEAPLAWVREHGPDIRAAFALAWELLRSPGPIGLLETVLGVDIESVLPMLRAGGIRYSSTWYLLDRMADKCSDNELLLSAALYVSNLLRRHEDQDIEKALKIRERLLHNDDPRTLSCLHALAQTRHLQTKYDLAEPLFHKSVEARQRVLGFNHPHTLDSIEGLAECISDRGRYTEAEPLLKEVVKGREEVLGEFHPRTLESNTNVANCYGKQGRQAAAEELHRKNLQARSDVLGPDHLKTYDCMQCLAICLRQQGKAAEALPLFWKTLEGRQRILGKENPATYDTLNSYANCVSDEGNAKEAEGLYRQVLDARKAWSAEHMHGNGDLAVFECMNNLADSLRAQGKHKEAEDMYRQTLEGRQRVLKDHPDTFQSMNNLAILLEEQGKHEAAEPLREAARAGLERRLGLEHPDAIKLNRNQAIRLSLKGESGTLLISR